MNVKQVAFEGAYEVIKPIDQFFGQFFPFSQRDLITKNRFSYDIRRSGEQIAYAIRGRNGTHHNDFRGFLNKEFDSPFFSESFDITADTLNEYRQFGTTGIENMTAAEIRANQIGSERIEVLNDVAHATAEIKSRYMRTMEKARAELLQTGKYTLTDEDGNLVYEIDFKPKTGHFITNALADWDTTKTQLEALASAIRDDSGVDPDVIVMHPSVWKIIEQQMIDAKVYDQLRVNKGSIEPKVNATRATRQGTFTIGDYEFEMYTYSGSYKDSQGITVKYMYNTAASKPALVMMSSRTDLFRTKFITSKFIGTLDDDVLGYLPDNGEFIQYGSEGMAVFYNAHIDKRKSLHVELEMKPVLQPTYIDTFGCILVG